MPHQAFEGRAPGEFMQTEEARVVVLQFVLAASPGLYQSVEGVPSFAKQ